MGLPWWCNGEEFACQHGGHGFSPWPEDFTCHGTLSQCTTANEAELWSPQAATSEPWATQLLQPALHEKPPRRAAHAPQRAVPACCT